MNIKKKKIIYLIYSLLLDRYYVLFQISKYHSISILYRNQILLEYLYHNIIDLIDKILRTIYIIRKFIFNIISFDNKFILKIGKYYIYINNTITTFRPNFMIFPTYKFGYNRYYMPMIFIFIFFIFFYFFNFLQNLANIFPG